MAINFKDGVILGADSRTTTGAYIANRVTDKLTQVHDTIWCCRSGSAADTQAVADIVAYHLNMYGITNNEPPSTQVAAGLFQELCYENKEMLRWVDLCLLFYFTSDEAVPESSSPGMIREMEARCTRYRWEDLSTSSPFPSEGPVRRTSTDTVTRTGRRT